MCWIWFIILLKRAVFLKDSTAFQCSQQKRLVAVQDTSRPDNRKTEITTENRKRLISAAFIVCLTCASRIEGEIVYIGLGPYNSTLDKWHKLTSSLKEIVFEPQNSIKH